MSRAPADPPDLDERQAWLRLLLTDGLGREAVRRLLAAFGSAPAVWRAAPSSRQAVVGSAAQAMLSLPADWGRWCADTEAWLHGGPGRAIWPLGHPDFPPLLLQTADPPLLLFAEGDASLLQRPAVAVVGSRHPSAQGRDNARAFARALSDAGLAVVSGLAQGIDGAAHEGALEGPGGTVAVIGTGPDRVYPARHKALAARIAAQGLVLSEYLPGTPPLPPNFPRRNRLIAGLAQGTLVVEAALRSGSLITARLAAEAGREVFAIPGSIHAPQSRGCHALIRQGAKLVESAQDVLEELSGRPLRMAAPDDAGGDSDAGAPEPLLDALGLDPVTLDALSARTGWSAQQLNVQLLELELEGRVARLPGGLFQRRVAT